MNFVFVPFTKVMAKSTPEKCLRSSFATENMLILPRVTEPNHIVGQSDMVKPNSCLVDQRLGEVSLVLLTRGSDGTFLRELLY